MTTRTNQRTGQAPVRRIFAIAGAVALAAAPVSFPAQAEAATAAEASRDGIAAFYEARDGRPLWFTDGEATPAGQKLLELLSSASVDGLDPDKYRTAKLDKALQRAWGGNERAVRKADRLLTEAFAAYARDLRKDPSAGLKYIDPGLLPRPLEPQVLLTGATSAPSLFAYVANMGWMNPAYAPLRRALEAGKYDGERQRNLLRINLERARVLPSAMPRYVIVNAAEQRLSMYDGGKLTGTMRVVVGKERDKDKTPMMASFVREAALNPYWNVPPDLAAERIAPNAIKYGLGYLKQHGYEVLSDWSEDATVIDPAAVDWQAVVDGTSEVRIRQLPGPGNALGKVKYNFSNPYGVYLHDTPDKHLLTEETRLFSGGCIRLEDAARFGEWLAGRELKPSSSDPEIVVPLESPVPIYVTYLTAVPNGQSVTFLDDVYGWDGEQLAAMDSGGGQVAVR